MKGVEKHNIGRVRDAIFDYLMSSFNAKIKQQEESESGGRRRRTRRKNEILQLEYNILYYI